MEEFYEVEAYEFTNKGFRLKKLSNIGLIEQETGESS